MIRRAFCSQGFTLLEVLVALAVIAIALAAGSRAAGALVHNAERRSDVMLAQWCAENALVQVRLATVLPPIGTTQSPCEQAARHYRVDVVTSATVNPSLRRVDARVLDGSEALILSLTTMVGRF